MYAPIAATIMTLMLGGSCCVCIGLMVEGSSCSLILYKYTAHDGTLSQPGNCLGVCLSFKKPLQAKQKESAQN